MLKKNPSQQNTLVLIIHQIARGKSKTLQAGIINENVAQSYRNSECNKQRSRRSEVRLASVSVTPDQDTLGDNNRVAL